MYASREDIGYDFGDDSKVGSKPIKPNPNIDGGWAWMIVLSSFLVHILIMGSQMALGILNMEWLEEFNQSRGLTAWVSSLSMGITLIVGMFQRNLFQNYVIFLEYIFHSSLKCFVTVFHFICRAAQVAFLMSTGQILQVRERKGTRGKMIEKTITPGDSMSRKGWL